jgi:hypothetical protein
MMDVSEFKKSYRVYAIVGAACANTTFRRKLFRAFDAHNADTLRAEVNRCLETSGDRAPRVTDEELAMIWSFVAPRTISAAGAPPIGVKGDLAGPTTMSFEAACDAFSSSVCPHWPCDDFSA